MEKVDIERLNHIEGMISWLLSIDNEYNRVRLVSDKQLVRLIKQKLDINEAEY